MNQHCPNQVRVFLFFCSLYGIVSEKIWGMIKTTVPYQIPGYKTLELVVESQLVSNSDHYDPCPTSIPKSNNPILVEEITHSQTQEQPPTCIRYKIWMMMRKKKSDT
jgi:hypothetical protein